MMRLIAYTWMQFNHDNSSNDRTVKSLFSSYNHKPPAEIDGTEKKFSGCGEEKKRIQMERFKRFANEMRCWSTADMKKAFFKKTLHQLLMMVVLKL